MEIWHYWIIAGLVLLIWEIVNPGFVIGVFGLGCFASGIACFFDASLNWQVAIFAIVSLLGFIFIRPLFLKFFYRKDQKSQTGVCAMIGKNAYVTEEINGALSVGKVKLGGEIWRAKNLSETVLSVGSEVKIKDIEGNTLLVTKVNEEDQGEKND